VKSSGKSLRNGSSVEPGFPKIVVAPSSRKRPRVTSRTVARVYLARDEVLDRDVALKVLREQRG
jgi:hypothetical protein